jgi:hypothetical protein
MKKLAWMGPGAVAATARKSEAMLGGLEYAKPKLPTQPVFTTSATNAGVLIPPAIGAWIMGTVNDRKNFAARIVFIDNWFFQKSENMVKDSITGRGRNSRCKHRMVHKKKRKQ